jgi:hypothetical protein
MNSKLIVKHGFAYAVRAVASTTTALMVVVALLMRFPENYTKPPKPSIKHFFKDTKYLFANLA